MYVHHCKQTPKIYSRGQVRWYFYTPGPGSQCESRYNSKHFPKEIHKKKDRRLKLSKDIEYIMLHVLNLLEVAMVIIKTTCVIKGQDFI